MDEINPTFPKLVELADSYGNTFRSGNAGDYWHPPVPIGQDSDYRTHVRRIRDMEIRPDDVIFSSFPKMGLHWNHEIVGMLMAKSSEYQAYDHFGKGGLDFRPMCFIDQQTSPRLLTTHVPFRYFPRQALEKKIKIVRLDRNPKDVLVSYYNLVHAVKKPFHYAGTFHHFFRLFMDAGCLFQFVNCTTREGAILDLFFCNIKPSYRCFPHALLGSFDHSMLLLLPKYKPVYKRLKPVGKIVDVWNDEVCAELQDHYGDLFDYLMEWQEGMEAHPEVDIYTSVYEDMLQDPIQGVLKLNAYLGTGCSQELCEEITKACSFDKLKPARISIAPGTATAAIPEEAFFRKGKIGDWKNWFTVSMNDEFDKEYKKRMSAYKRQYKYVFE